jgi:release factor glutamine methyltransferase
MAAATVWTITKILDWTRQYFAGKGIENPRLDAELLLCEVLHCQRIMLYVHFDQPLEPSELARYREFVLRRGRLEPLAYILGHREFMKYDFKVTPAVLVPRPETELLVEKILQAVKYAAGPKLTAQTAAVSEAARVSESADAGEAGEPAAMGNEADAAAEAGLSAPLQLLDIGTGSGAIILTLLKELPQATGTAVDKSPEALAIAQANGAKLGVAERVRFLASDLLQKLSAEDLYDVIVSNPPYIPSGVIATLAQDVQKEPRLALDGGADGLDLYRLILKEAPAHLKTQGLLALEIGTGQGAAVTELCRKAGLEVQVVLKDYAHLERMVLATKEGTKYADFILGLKESERL